MRRLSPSMIPLSEGQRAQDVLPQFAEVRHEVKVGTPAPDCAGCRKPFTAVRQRRMNVRLYPVDFPVPIAFAYCLCGTCGAKYRSGGIEREAVVAAVEAFHLGDEPCA